MAHSRKIRIYFWIFLAVTIVFIGFTIKKEKIITYKCNHHFYPRADLNMIYNNFDHLEIDSISNATNIQDYYQNLRKSTVIGTSYYTPSTEYIFGFDMFEPKFQNENVQVLYDSGKIVFDSPLPNNTQTLYFDTCAFKYNGADLFNKYFMIQNNADQEGFILGYVCTVYMSPSGKVKSNYLPLGSNVVTVNTRDKNYFLKELCVFSLYKGEIYALQNEVLYQIKINDNNICDFVIQRTQSSEE